MQTTTLADCLSLTQFLADATQAGRIPAGLAEVIEAVAGACAAISATLETAVLVGASGNAGAENVHGETQKMLDVVSNDIMLDRVGTIECLRALASEELASIVVFERPLSVQPSYLLLVDPLDGSSNLDINSVVGSIFSVLAAPAADDPPDAASFLQPGTRQLCGGYAIYGAATMLVVTTGHGVDGFTFDPRCGAFVLTHPRLRVPDTSAEFAVNMSNQRFWERPVMRYVEECVAGTEGVRGKNFNMRWIASMVAEVHRILLRGGVFLYPRDSKNPPLEGRLRLTYEANPMSFLIEQAGGLSTTGRVRIMEIQPAQVHQRVPVMLGSKCEVERLLRYHQDEAA